MYIWYSSGEDEGLTWCTQMIQLSCKFSVGVVAACSFMYKLYHTGGCRELILCCGLDLSPMLFNSWMLVIFNMFETTDLVSLTLGNEDCKVWGAELSHSTVELRTWLPVIVRAL